MLAVDTNLVLRLIMEDNDGQYDRVLRVFDIENIFLPKSVILEMEWVLRSIHGIAPAVFIGAVEPILSLPNVHTEDESEVRQALEWHRDGMDFADALHLASSSRATRFLTFDRDMVKLARKFGLPVAFP